MLPKSRRRFLQQTASLAAISSFAAPALAESSKPKIKVGQIGVGHAHATKLSVYRQSGDYEVVGIVEPDDSLWQGAQSNPAFKDLPRLSRSQLLETPGLQAVLVETEVADLLDNAQACIDARMHVHLDKPAGESLPKYKRLLESAQQKQLLVQMGYMYRYNPAVIMLRDFLKQGWLGDVFEVHTVMSKVVPPSSRQQLAQYPGGMMFELGCHIMDLVIGVLGAPQQVTAVNQHVSPINDNLLDNMLAVLTYPQAIATVKSSALEVEGFSRRHFVVCGSEGTFHIQPLDNPTARVALSQRRGQYAKGLQEIKFPRFSRYVADAADMAKIIRKEKESDFSYGHDLAVQQTLLEACNC